MTKLKFIPYLALLLLFVVKGVWAQNIEVVTSDPTLVNDAETFAGPGRVSGSLILNNGIVWPLEDLDSFQSSTIENTFNGRVRQKSNVEINKPKANRFEFTQEPQYEEAVQTETLDNNPSPTNSNDGARIYTWTDKNGIKHFTNRPDSVPLEYRKKDAEGGKK